MYNINLYPVDDGSGTWCLELQPFKNSSEIIKHYFASNIAARVFILRGFK